MRARKFVSNSPEVLTEIPQELRAFEIDLKDDLPTTKTHGVLWRAQQDVLAFKVKTPNEQDKLTKRITLSKVARVFDPLGLASPFTIHAKVLNWDESRKRLVL